MLTITSDISIKHISPNAFSKFPTIAQNCVSDGMLLRFKFIFPVNIRKLFILIFNFANGVILYEIMKRLGLI